MKTNTVSDKIKVIIVNFQSAFSAANDRFCEVFYKKGWYTLHDITGNKYRESDLIRMTQTLNERAERQEKEKQRRKQVNENIKTVRVTWTAEFTTIIKVPAGCCNEQGIEEYAADIDLDLPGSEYVTDSFATTKFVAI